MNRNKKNIAVFAVGILPTGPSNPGVPSMINVLKVLREKNSVTLYSFIPVDYSRAPANLRVRSIGKSRATLKIKYAILFLRFVADHLVRKFDVIHAQSPYPAGTMSIRINKFFKIPWILFLDGSETISMPDVPFGDLLNPHLKNAAVEACDKAPQIVALTNYQAELTKASMNLSREILVLPRGVEVPTYRKKSIDSPIRFVHISTYHPIKDYETLLKTFSILAHTKSCELVMIGKNEHTSITELIQSLNLEDKVKFLGPVPNEKLSEVFSSAHFLLHTSIYESMGMVVVEAMANGVLVAGTRVGIIADLAQHCVTSNTKDFNSLADGISSIAEDETNYEQLRRSGYDWIKNHDLNWYVTELEAVYDNVITQSSQSLN